MRPTSSELSWAYHEPATCREKARVPRHWQPICTKIMAGARANMQCRRQIRACLGTARIFWAASMVPSHQFQHSSRLREWLSFLRGASDTIRSSYDCAHPDIPLCALQRTTTTVWCRFTATSSSPPSSTPWQTTPIHPSATPCSCGWTTMPGMAAVSLLVLPAFSL